MSETIKAIIKKFVDELPDIPLCYDDPDKWISPRKIDENHPAHKLFNRGKKTLLGLPVVEVDGEIFPDISGIKFGGPLIK